VCLEVKITDALTITQLEEKILKEGRLTPEEALSLSGVSGPDLFSLFASAQRIRDRFRGRQVELCSIINAKSGACTEDCVFCAQSSRSRARVDVYPLLDKETVIRKALDAKREGMQRFSLVTSGKRIPEKYLPDIADMISEIRNAGLLPCASLGLLGEEELSFLKHAGLDRYHHNLETSERFFPDICATHTYADKITTISAAGKAGLSVCSGGIFGMGETWQDRVEMAFALSRLTVDSVPINFLTPIPGTLLGTRSPLPPFEALQIVALFRHVLPDREIRVCGGRVQVLGEFHPLVFSAGADGLMTGNYLTTLGRSPGDDISLIENSGLSVLRQR
jgi:biotin synthase